MLLRKPQAGGEAQGTSAARRGYNAGPHLGGRPCTPPPRAMYPACLPLIPPPPPPAPGLTRPSAMPRSTRAIPFKPQSGDGGHGALG